MQELVKHTSKMDVALEEKNRKYARAVVGYTQNEGAWDEHFINMITKLWQDKGVQTAYQEATRYQLQVNNMDYLMEHMSRFAKVDFVPTNEDILVARQRSTGAYRTLIKKEKRNTWELIDCGGQIGERKKWEAFALTEGLNSIIFFAGLDEFNMISCEDKSKTKMEIARGVFSEIVNSPITKDITKILFLNKQDLFAKKLADEIQFEEFKTKFPDYKGDNSVEVASEFIANKFRSSMVDESADVVHYHVISTLDTSAIEEVFEAIQNNLSTRKTATLQKRHTL